MDPINGINELFRLLRQSDGNKKPKEAPSNSSSRHASKGVATRVERDSAAQVMQSIKVRIAQMDRDTLKQGDSIEIFIDAVLAWKFRDFDESINSNNLSSQVRDAILSDPVIKTKLSELIDKL